MTNASTAISTEANTVALVGQTISRSQIENLIAQTTQPLVFEACDFEGVDLSRLNLRGFEFQDCAFMEESLYAALAAESHQHDAFTDN